MSKIAVLGYRLDGVRSGAHLTHLELGGFLAERGHKVAFGALQGDEETRLGHQVFVGKEHIRRIVDEADLVMLRDEMKVGFLLPYCRDANVLYTCHSPAGDPRELGVELPASARLIWVSAAVASQAQIRRGPYAGAHQVIEGCPIDPARYLAAPGNRVTLANLSLRKGGNVFWEMASRMPDIEFLGVLGWGKQVIRPKPPANVKIMHRVADAREIYRETRVMLLPSAETGTIRTPELPAWGEAWNRVGAESAVNGIPVIAHPAAGIRASLGDAATYVDRDDLDGWEREIRRLEDPAYWLERSTVAHAWGGQVLERSQKVLDAYDALVQVAA